ncbi:MAG TPA: FAD-binding protein [Actinomycetes bacterium]|nr:FAD-binding protein [Actinomycetes bacterium]
MTVATDVVVVGAGLAGLVAARDLVAAGAEWSCWRPATGSAAVR